MLDRADGQHDESECRFGGVKAVGTVDHEPDAAIQTFVAGIVHTEANRGEDPLAVLADRL
jgi:hypothetical protein